LENKKTAYPLEIYKNPFLLLLQESQVAEIFHFSFSLRLSGEFFFLSGYWDW
jgi:hypothetical protein